MKKERGYQTEWDLSYFYTSFKELDAHIEEIDKAFSLFEKKYKKKDDYLGDEIKLFKALADYEKLYEQVPTKPLRYLSLKNSLNASDKTIQTKLTATSQRLTDIYNKILFFELRLGTISKPNQKKFLKSDILKHYRFFLFLIFESSKHHLSEKEERILNLKYLTSQELWVLGLDKVISEITVEFKDKVIPLSEAIDILPDISTKERRELWKKSMKALEPVEPFYESGINAFVLNRKISDELRGFDKPYGATALSYQNDETTIESLVEAVTSSFSISHKFYKLKKKLLQADEFFYEDRVAKIGEINKTFTFEESTELLKEAFGSFGDLYKEILESMLLNGQVDVYPKKGKSGGAFCAGTENLPTYVLLNHVDNVNSYRTYAHEIGHAIQYELSKTKPILYQDFTHSIAEVASIFFENLASDRIRKELTEKEQVITLHNSLNDSMSTVFRQIAFFNFEKELHEVIRKHGSISIEDMKSLMNKHMSSYLGPAVTMKDIDGNFFLYVSHFRHYYFYVYSYAYGELISSALYEKYLEDPLYEEKIRAFLSAGGSMKPDDVFASIGINTRDPEFFKLGIKKIEKEIATLERLAKKVGMIQ